MICKVISGIWRDNNLLRSLECWSKSPWPGEVEDVFLDTGLEVRGPFMHGPPQLISNSKLKEAISSGMPTHGDIIQSFTIWLIYSTLGVAICDHMFWLQSMPDVLALYHCSLHEQITVSNHASCMVNSIAFKVLAILEHDNYTYNSHSRTISTHYHSIAYTVSLPHSWHTSTVTSQSPIGTYNG